MPLKKFTTISQRKHLDEERGHQFDVAMGAYDGAEVCELVGTFLFEEASGICN